MTRKGMGKRAQEKEMKREEDIEGTETKRKRRRRRKRKSRLGLGCRDETRRWRGKAKKAQAQGDSILLRVSFFSGWVRFWFRRHVRRSQPMRGHASVWIKRGGCPLGPADHVSSRGSGVPLQAIDFLGCFRLSR